ncbi:obscurin-like, partial [Contarinia nasturtii]|uniref:obscurin-like n=1 Tax=Contarinia nasturtii TaxID=265458 RepID=UPI0012D4A4F6
LASNEEVVAASCADVIVKEKHEPREKRPIFLEYIDSCRAVEGYPIKLEARVAAHPKPTIEWYHDGEKIESDQDHVKIVQKEDGTTSCLIDTVRMCDRGEYKIIAKNNLGKAFTSGYLAVSSQATGREPRKEKPDFVVDLFDRNVKEGTPLSLDVKIASYAEPEIKWLHDGEQILPDNKHIIISQKPDGSSSLKIDKVKSKDAGEYIVICANEIGAATSKATIKVLPEANDNDDYIETKPRFIVKLEDQDVQKGQTLELEAKINPCVEEVKWLHDEKEILDNGDRIKISTDADGVSKLSIHDIVPEDGGDYRVVASNQQGRASSSASLKIENAQVTDSSVYKVYAKNEHGEASSKANVQVLDSESKPSFSKKLISCAAPENSPVSFEVKVSGHPKPRLQWYHNDEEIDSDDDNITLVKNTDGTAALAIGSVTAYNSGTYKVCASNKYGVVESEAELTVLVKPKFEKALEDIEVVEGLEAKFEIKVIGNPRPNLEFFQNSRKITSDGYYTKINYNSNGIATLTIPKVSKVDHGDYRVVAQNSAGTVESCAKLSVVSKRDVRPTFQSHLSDQRVKEGEPIELTVEVTGKPQIELQWLHNGKPINTNGERYQLVSDSDTTHTLKINDAELSDAGEYSLIATNAYGSLTSSAAVSIVKDKQKGQAPEFLKCLEDINAEIGSLVKLSVQISGIPEPKIKWLHNGEVVVPQIGYIRLSEYPDGTHTLAMNDVSPKTSGKYTVVATNNFGSVESVGTVNVFAKPDIIKGLKDIEVEENSQIKFELRFEAYPEPTLKWTHDGEDIIPDGNSIVVTQSPDGTATLTINEAKLSNAGDYRVEISSKNVAGKKTTQAHLSVTPKPQEERGEAPVFIVPLEDTQAHLGSSARFEIEIAAKPEATLKWLHKNKPIVPQRGVVRITENPDGTTVFYLNAVTTENAGQYQVIATNKFGSCSSKAMLSVVAKPSITGDLKDLEVQQNSTLALDIKFEGTPQPTINWYHNGQEITPDDQHKTLTEDNGIAALNINEATIDDGGEYRIVLKNDFGTTSSNAFVSVISNDKENMPAFISGLYNRSVEIDQPIKFDIKVAGSPQPTLKFLHNGKEFENIPNEISIKEDQDGTCTLSIANVSQNDAGEYRIIAYNSHGTATTNAILTVLSKPKIVDGLKDVDTVEGSPIVLSVKIKAYPSADVRWYLNGSEIVPDGRFVKISQGPDGLYSLEIPKAAISDSGEYAVESINEHGSDLSKALVSVSTKSNIILQHGEKPDFEEGLEDAEVDIGSTMLFSVFVTGVPKPTLKWLHNGKEILPEKGRIKISENPDGSVGLTISEATFTDAGEYRVIASNQSGTTASEGSLSVLSKPVFLSALKDQYLIEGDTAKFEAVLINGSPQTQIEWFWNEQIIQPSDYIKIDQLPNGTCILTVDSVSPDDIGKNRIRIVATNKYGKASSDANLLVSPNTSKRTIRTEKPTFVEELSNLQIYEGFPAKFNVKVTGNPDLKWYRNDKEIQSKNGVARISLNPDGTAYLILHEVCPSDQGNFKVVAINEHGSAESCGELSVSVLPEEKNYDNLLAARNDSDTEALPEILANDLKDQSVYESTPVSFEIIAQGIPKLDVEWTLNDKPLKSNDHYTITEDGLRYKLSIADVKLTDAGTFKVVVKNKLGELSKQCDLSVMPVAEYRKPILIEPLKDVQSLKNAPVELAAIITADPLPEITWLKYGEKFEESLDVQFKQEVKELEHGLKKVKYYLYFPAGRHCDTGSYTLL